MTLTINNLDKIVGEKISIGQGREDWKFTNPTKWSDHYHFPLINGNKMKHVHIHRDRMALEYNNEFYKMSSNFLAIKNIADNIKNSNLIEQLKNVVSMVDQKTLSKFQSIS